MTTTPLGSIRRFGHVRIIGVLGVVLRYTEPST
jgi:hypothetical protein